MGCAGRRLGPPEIQVSRLGAEGGGGRAGLGQEYAEAALFLSQPASHPGLCLYVPDVSLHGHSQLERSPRDRISLGCA